MVNTFNVLLTNLIRENLAYANSWGGCQSSNSALTKSCGENF